MKELTQDRLKELLDYNPETGVFTRKVTVSAKAKAGDIAGCPNWNGYLRIRVDGKDYSAHRLAFLYMTGSLPPANVDHTNHVRNDNRWINLRTATTKQNNRSTSSHKGASSKYLGVSRCKREGKWRAQIKVDGKVKTLGYFLDEADAATAYNFAAHQHHGEFANFNQPLSA